MWNCKGILWNSTQNILPIHWKIWFLYSVQVLRAPRFKSSYAFLWAPHPTPTPHPPSLQSSMLRIRQYMLRIRQYTATENPDNYQLFLHFQSHPFKVFLNCIVTNQHYWCQVRHLLSFVIVETLNQRGRTYPKLPLFPSLWAEFAVFLSAVKEQMT